MLGFGALGELALGEFPVAGSSIVLVTLSGAETLVLLVDASARDILVFKVKGAVRIRPAKIVAVIRADAYYFTKPVEEDADYVFDYKARDYLIEDETIVSATAALAGDDASALVVDVSFTPTLVALAVSGGVLGKTAKITITTMTSRGRERLLMTAVRIREQNAWP